MSWGVDPNSKYYGEWKASLKDDKSYYSWGKGADPKVSNQLAIDSYNQYVKNKAAENSQPESKYAYDTNYGNTLEDPSLLAGAADAVGDEYATHAGEASDYVTPEMMIQNQMASILNSDSDYMKQAAARGRSAAQAKGFSSSMAGIQAVNKEMISSARSMAEKNVDTLVGFSEREQEGDILTDSQIRGFVQDLFKSQQYYGIQSSFYDQLFQQELATNEQAFEFAKGLAEVNFNFDKELKDMDITSEERQSYGMIMGTIMSGALQSIVSVMNNPDIKDKGIAYKNVWNGVKGLLNTAGSIFGFEFDFKKLGLGA